VDGSLPLAPMDFWGITNSYEIKPHLQSYFIFFNKNIFSDNVFHTFWNNYLVYKDKRSIIEKYEVGLTDMLVTQGFKYDTFCDAKDVASNKKINITHHFWKELVIQQKCPIIKIELLRDNPVQVNIVNWQNILTDNTNYDIKLIENHLTRMKNR
jgi:rhamnosyltransferase